MRGVPLDAEGVHKQVVSAWQARDWDRLRELLHPEGTFESTAAGGRFVDAEDLVGSLEAAHRTVDSVPGLTYEKVSNDFVLAMGCVRHLGEDGDSPSRAVWLVETRGGLAYRSTPFDTRESALAEYERRCVLARALRDVAAA
jgi:hypothetical protein